MAETSNEILRRLRSAKDNWDSYGAVPVSERALRITELLLSGNHGVVPMPGGGVLFDWPNGMSIEIEPKGADDPEFMEFHEESEETDNET